MISNTCFDGSTVDENLGLAYKVIFPLVQNDDF